MKIILLELLFAVASQSAEEGESCTKEGLAGVCTNIRRCTTALEDIRRRKPPQHCGFGGVDPIVCCVPSVTETTITTPTFTPPPTSPPVLTTTKRTQTTSTTEYIPPTNDYVDVNDKSNGNGNDECPPLPPTLTSMPTGQKAWDKCLEYQDKLVFPCGKSQALTRTMVRSNHCNHNADELIVGGEAAAPNEFPHMALLGYGADPANLQWLCGGSLISERFVLTAGHCIASRDAGNVSHVQLATLSRSSMPLRYRHGVRRIIKHPLYNPPQKYNDIALLELENPVDLDQYTVPACVHTGAPVDDSRASTIGWGLTAYRGNTSDTLQKVILSKFDFLECAFTYKPNRLMRNGVDDSSQICYGDRTLSRDTCQGDSGGPLQIKSKKIACMYVLVGVTSFGKGCGFVGVPGIYTRVAHYLDWIETTVWP